MAEGYHEDEWRELRFEQITDRLSELEVQLDEAERCKKQLRLEFESLRTIILGSDFVPPQEK